MQTLEDALGSRVNIAVLRYLTAINGPLSGNEIAQRLNLQQSSVRLALERLVASGVVTRTDVGRSAGYELDQRLAFVRTLLIPLFREENRLRGKLLAALARSSGKLNPRPCAVVLFGSVAQGVRNFNDIDLLCVVANEQDKALLQDSVGSTYSPIQREFKVPISALVATETELSTSRLASIVKEAHRDGLLLFGSAPRPLHAVREWEGAERRRE